MHLSRFITLGLCLVGLLGSTGCKDQVQQLQAQVEQATKSVQQAAPAILSPGEIKLQCGESITTKAGHCRVLTLGMNRPNVVQLRSYTDPKTEIFPSVFFQGVTDATQVSELSGKTVKGTLFAQATENGPIWQTPLGQVVEVQFSSIEGSEILGTFSTGNLVDPSGRSSQVSGTFRATGAANSAPRNASILQDRSSQVADNRPSSSMASSMDLANVNIARGSNAEGSQP